METFRHSSRIFASNERFAKCLRLHWNRRTGAFPLAERFFTTPKHQAIRATDDASFFFTNLSGDYTNSRLIGRSVWNTEWKLVIPANTLLAESEEGLDRFIRSVRDIKLYFRTYSYSGN